MTDTSPKIRNKMIKLMRRKSGVERLKMGADMFDMAKRLILISMQDRDVNVRQEIFLRFYGNDFSGERKEKILKYFET